MTERRLHLPKPLADAIVAAAASAYPDEACGLIEGEVCAEGWRAHAVHDAANLAEDPSRHFVVDPSAQFALLRRLRHSEYAIIGCFHSHPDGAPVPSESDRLGAVEDGFLWLIAGGSPQRGFTLALHIFNAQSHSFSQLDFAA
jgi:proteasome lid subunit RPN8/RPN11